MACLVQPVTKLKDIQFTALKHRETQEGSQQSSWNQRMFDVCAQQVCQAL